jgi:pimeloyl-ACP methyl ester carboxylesterase
MLLLALALQFHDGHIAPDRILRYACAGHGAPTVLVEQGLGISLEEVFARQPPVGWAVIFPKVAAVTRVCVYDRAGLGRSSKLAAPATSLDAARDLKALLRAQRIQPPLVLAGQSLGAMDVLMFAGTYADWVQGVVLVDSAHPQQQRRFAEVLPPRGADESEFQRGFRDGPTAPQAGEWFNFPANTQAMQQLPNLGSTPLIVLTHDPERTTPEGPVPARWWSLTEPVWQQLQVELAGLSTNSQHRVVEHAGHNIQFEQPQVVADAILDVVGQVRARSRP